MTTRGPGVIDMADGLTTGRAVIPCPRDGREFYDALDEALGGYARARLAAYEDGVGGTFVWRGDSPAVAAMLQRWLVEGRLAEATISTPRVRLVSRGLTWREPYDFTRTWTRGPGDAREA